MKMKTESYLTNGYLDTQIKSSRDKTNTMINSPLKKFLIDIKSQPNAQPKQRFINPEFRKPKNYLDDETKSHEQILHRGNRSYLSPRYSSAPGARNYLEQRENLAKLHQNFSDLVITPRTKAKQPFNAAEEYRRQQEAVHHEYLNTNYYGNNHLSQYSRHLNYGDQPFSRAGSLESFRNRLPESVRNHYARKMSYGDGFGSSDGGFNYRPGSWNGFPSYNREGYSPYTSRGFPPNHEWNMYGGYGIGASGYMALNDGLNSTYPNLPYDKIQQRIEMRKKDEGFKNFYKPEGEAEQQEEPQVEVMEKQNTPPEKQANSYASRSSFARYQSSFQKTV